MQDNSDSSRIAFESISTTLCLLLYDANLSTRMVLRVLQIIVTDRNIISFFSSAERIVDFEVESEDRV